MYCSREAVRSTEYSLLSFNVKISKNKLFWSYENVRKCGNVFVSNLEYEFMNLFIFLQMNFPVWSVKELFSPLNNSKGTSTENDTGGKNLSKEPLRPLHLHF